MICSACNKDANDNACAYYDVGKFIGRRWHPIWKCWWCMSPEEKVQREDKIRFTVKQRSQEQRREDRLCL